MRQIEVDVSISEKIKYFPDLFPIFYKFGNID